jgi:hypothetical protein
MAACSVVDLERNAALVPSRIIPPDGAVTLLTVIQVYAHFFVKLLDELRTLEEEAHKLDALPDDHPRIDYVEKVMRHTVGYCDALALSSARKQLRYMAQLWTRTTPPVSVQEAIADIGQLRRRIHEDLEDHVFFCVPDPLVVRSCFKSEYSAELDMNILVQKHAHELFEPKVVERFPSAIDDIEEASRCFVTARYTATVFHLMPIVKTGVLSVAKLAGIDDAKASWGAVLKKIEKYALWTEYKDLPADVQPHIALLKDLLPRMQAIQHAWRNKVSHVESKLIPTETGINKEIANEIMTATQAFMRKLATEL